MRQWAYSFLAIQLSKILCQRIVLSKNDFLVPSLTGTVTTTTISPTALPKCLLLLESWLESPTSLLLNRAAPISKAWNSFMQPTNSILGIVHFSSSSSITARWSCQLRVSHSSSGHGREINKNHLFRFRLFDSTSTSSPYAQSKLFYSRDNITIQVLMHQTNKRQNERKNPTIIIMKHKRSFWLEIKETPLNGNYPPSNQNLFPTCSTTARVVFL